MKRSLFLYACLFVAVVAVGVGLYMSGSPSRARAQRYDQQRVNDLQQISYGLDNYWVDQRKLPADLPELSTPREKYYVPSIRDPRTQAIYEYRQTSVTSSGNYELCANFELDTQSSPPSLARPIDPPFWQHGAGRVCFPLQVRTMNSRPL